MDKQELENEKLRLEIDYLKKAWYRKPEMLRVVLPTILAIFSLIYAISTGFFSSKQEILELKKAQLTLEISEFEKEKIAIIETNNKLKKRTKQLNDSLDKQIERAIRFENAINTEITKKRNLSQELEAMKKTKRNLDKSIESLAKDYDKKKSKYLSELEKNYHQQINYEQETIDCKKQLDELRSKIKRLEYNLEIVNSNPYIKLTKKFDFKQWNNQKMIEYSEAEISKHENELKKLEKDLDKSQKSSDSLEIKMKLNRMK